MFDGIRIFSSDVFWRQILVDLGAVVLDVPNTADVNMDVLDIPRPVDIMDLQIAVLNAMDRSKIIRKIFGRPVSLSPMQEQIIAILDKSGGVGANDLKVALGYSPDASTHAVDTAIYQLRHKYGRDFILQNDGIYTIGRI
ncbi:MAG: DUF3124 domain-containing protein [Alphaproteobacteria bacterium]|nr:DUF3124 domain-containing protein [Alphaproteobacteria bacterium]